VRRQRDDSERHRPEKIAASIAPASFYFGARTNFNKWMRFPADERKRKLSLPLVIAAQSLDLGPAVSDEKLHRDAPTLMYDAELFAAQLLVPRESRQFRRIVARALFSASGARMLRRSFAFSAELFAPFSRDSVH